MSRFDPFAADPRYIAVAVRTDRRLHLGQGDVFMRVRLEHADPVLGFDESFELTVRTGTDNVRLDGGVGRWEHVISAAFAAGDIARYEAAQAKARAARSAGGNNGRGTLSIGVRGGCRSGELAGRDIVVSTYLRTGPASGFFSLTRGMPLQKMLGSAPVSSIPACPGTAT